MIGFDGNFCLFSALDMGGVGSSGVYACPQENQT